MAKDNTLYLRRDKNRKSEKHPEFKGSGMAFGQEVWVSAYVNDGEDQDGRPEKYFKISIQPKQATVGKRAPNTAGDVEELDGDIPF